MAVAGAVIVLAAAVQLVAAQGSAFGEVPCQECPKVTFSHYEAKACEAVFDPEVSDCCPASFDCKTEEQRGIKKDQCIYKTVAYNAGDKVPVENPCEASCYCAEATETSSAQVTCAQVECPSLFGVEPEPGCRNLYSLDSCCSSDVECNIAAEANERASNCPSEGRDYLHGERMYFKSEPCQKCICSANFTDAFGPECKTIDCGMEYRDRSELEKGCVPLYYNGSCCNIEWICPGSKLVEGTPEQVATGSETPASHCTLGDIVAPRNTSITTTNCNTNCHCVTPPSFTCIQYANCDQAAQAEKEGRFDY